MRFGKSFLGMLLEGKEKVDPALDSEEKFELAPLCKYDKGACLCKRQIACGHARCVYKEEPANCYFEKSQPKHILDLSKSDYK